MKIKGISAKVLLFAAVAATGWLVTNRPTSNEASPAGAVDLRNVSGEFGRATDLIAASSWSKPVADAGGYILRGRLLLFDGPNIRGSWMHAPLYLELENMSPRADKILAVYFDIKDGFECQVRDAHGHCLTNSRTGGYIGPGTPWTHHFWVSLPPNGSVCLRVSPEVSASVPTPGVLTLQLAFSSAWTIPRDGRTYFISGDFSPPANHYVPPEVQAWQGKLVFPPMKISMRQP